MQSMPDHWHERRNALLALIHGPSMLTRQHNANLPGDLIAYNTVHATSCKGSNFENAHSGSQLPLDSLFFFFVHKFAHKFHPQTPTCMATVKKCHK